MTGNGSSDGHEGDWRRGPGGGQRDVTVAFRAVSQPVLVDTARIQAFQRAVPAAVDDAPGAAHALLCVSPLYSALSELRRGLPDLEERPLLHVEHRVELLRPPRSGRSLVADVMIGPPFSLGTRAAFEAQATVTDEEGTVAVMSGTFATDGTPTGPPRRLARGPRPRQPLGSVDVALPPDVTHHYAAACGDHDPIHLDDEAARRTGFGLPGRIVQGLCVLANAHAASVHLVPGGAARRVREIGARFAHWVLPGQTLTVEVSSTASADVYALRARVDDHVVLKGGWLALGR